ncbi:MAG: cadherin-like domain-containing protein [Bacteroidales bacterium]|nr:cadherin-like domain-containing protein [Bacteroidales bacterium]
MHKYMTRIMLSLAAIFLYSAARAALPVANGVSITTGPFIPGNVVTGTYSYFDADGDTESGTVIAWYQNTTASQSGASLITSGSTSFNVTAAYRGKYIAMAVTPSNATDGSGTTVYSNWELINSLPLADDESYANQSNEGADLSIAAPGVLNGDSDNDGHSLQAIVYTNPSHGTLTLNTNGSFIYSHDGTEDHTDNFTYRAYDGYEYSTAATVNIQVMAVNDPPVITSDPITTATEGVTYTYNITASDEETTALTISYVDILPSWLTPTNYGNGTGLLTGTPINDHVGTHALHLRVSDGSAYDDQEFEIEVSNVNNAPQLSNIEATQLSYEEGEAAKIISATLNVTDVDNDSLVSATITISGGLVSAEDRLSFIASAPLSSMYTQATGVLSITGKAPVADYRTALRNVKYRNTNEINPNDGNRTISFLVNDGTAVSNTVTRTIDFTAVNDPANAQPDNYFNVPEGGTLTTTAATGVLFNDEDLDGPSAKTAYLVANVQTGTLNFYADGRFNYVHNGTNVLSDMFTYYAWDGLDRSDTVEVNISMLPVNDPPVLLNIPEDTLTYEEGPLARTVIPNVIIEDEDYLEYTSATAVIDQGYIMSEDSLVFSQVSGITIVFDTLTGELTATGVGSFSSYQSLLRNIKYWNTNDENPNTQYRRVSFTISDGIDESDPVSRVIEIVPLNDAPIATEATIIGTDFYVDELLSIDYVFTDPDGDDEGNTSFRWYTAQDAQGSNRNMIVDWRLQDTFTTRFSEGGLYLSAWVRPTDEFGKVGIIDTTEWRYIDAAPEFINFTVKNYINQNVFAPGEVVHADFTYDDVEGDGEGNHEFQWYRNTINSWTGAAVLTGEVRDSFVIGESEKNRWIAVRGTPHALDGSSPGLVYQSQWFLVSELPVATLSIPGELDDSIRICEGVDEATLRVNLTGTNPPWIIKYTLNDGDTLISPEINVSPYDFTVTDTGTYVLVGVSDDKVPHGLFSGTAVVHYFEMPEATMPDAELTICNNDAASYEIPVNLSGVAPWKLSYQFDGAVDSSYVVNIDTAYYGINVSVAAVGNYELLHVWDANCVAAATGSTNVLVKESPIAFMEGDTSVCPNDPAILKIELSGVGPWSFTYTRDQGDEITETVNESGTSFLYELEVADQGIYELVGVTDTEDDGCASGSINVDHYVAPSATIGGTQRTCMGTPTEFEIALTGEAPWSLAYRHNTEPVDTIRDISTNPYPLSASAAGNYTITGVEDSHCVGAGSGVGSLFIDLLPEVSILGLESKYSIRTDAVLMNVEPEGGNFDLSDAPTAFWYNNNEWYFTPFFAYINYGSPFWVRYSYEDPATGCVGTDEERVFIIQNAAEIQIDNEKEMYCHNDDTLKIFGLNIRDNDGYFTITNNEGMVELDADSAVVFPWILKEGQKTITYTVDIDGEIEIAQKILNFNKVVGDFSWNKECLTDETYITFTDASSSSYGDPGWNWEFYFPDDTITADTSAATVFYNDLQRHEVQLIVSRSFNDDVCYDTVRKPFNLKPTIDVGSITYYETFANDTAYWTSSAISKNAQNSWTFGTPSSPPQGPWSGVPSTQKAWYTNVQNHLSAEDSYIISPCFDFSHAKQPMMIKLSLWKGFSQSFDGAVLQYTNDNGLNWHIIGEKDDGINWYNSTGIQGNPGDQPVGWTSNLHDEHWHTAKHKLDIPDLMESESVRFRIAYGATGQISENYGIAIDSIWIGVRKKNVLFEHFTNSSDEYCAFINSEVNALFNAAENNRDVIDIQYHIGQPDFGDDPFYDLNPEFVNSRKVYYNVQSVPYGVIDGGLGNQNQLRFTEEEELTSNQLNLAALEDNDFDINLDASPQSNYFDLQVEVIALRNIPEKELVLHVVVVENVIEEVTGANGETHFESVFKTMLPEAFGTTITRSWEVNDMEVYNFTYEYNGVFSDTSLRAVVFLQDPDTRKVYQAAIVDPNPKTDLGPAREENRFFDLFPNPAEEHTFLKLNEPLGAVSLEVMDINGRLVYQEDLYGAAGIIRISLEGLQDGMYTVSLKGKDQVYGIRKLIKLSRQ